MPGALLPPHAPFPSYAAAIFLVSLILDYFGYKVNVTSGAKVFNILNFYYYIIIDTFIY
jgi:hypothetical protein